MAEDKKSFLLYTDLIHTVNKMPNDKAGELFKHILSYVNDLNPETEDLIIELTFEPIKQQLKRDLLKYKESIIDKSNAGKLGNLKRWNKDLYDKVVDNQLDLQDALNIAESRKVSHTDNVQSQPIAEIAVNDNVNVNDKVINNIDSRKTSFANSIKPFLETYGKEMCTEFYKYWTEHGEKDKKMRFEKEKTFGIKQRLDRWKSNKSKFSTPTQKKDVLFVTPEGIEITDSHVLHVYQQTGKV
jgi:hypothetical protein